MSRKRTFVLGWIKISLQIAVVSIVLSRVGRDRALGGLIRPAFFLDLVVALFVAVILGLLGGLLLWSSGLRGPAEDVQR